MRFTLFLCTSKTITQMLLENLWVLSTFIVAIYIQSNIFKFSAAIGKFIEILIKTILFAIVAFVA